MRIRKFLLYTFYGFLIGVCMLVPGVSGGSVAVILGIYDELLEATAKVFAQFRKSVFTLSSVAFGGIIGFVSTSGLIGTLLKNAPFATVYFFMGTILGGIVLVLCGKGTNKKLNIPMIILGACAVIVLKFIPTGALSYSGGLLWLRFLIMILTGLLLGAALILPGMSFSMTLMILGIYEKFLLSVQRLDLNFVLPIAFATIFGVIVLSKLLLWFMNDCPRLCNSMIVGFVLASVVELFPGIPHGRSALLCLPLLMLGFCLAFGFALGMEGKKNVKTVTQNNG